MLSDKQLMQMALDALDKLLDKLNADICDNSGIWDEYCDGGNAMQALRARLAQPEPEPVAWKRPVYMVEDGWDEFGFTDSSGDDVPLYAAPPQREWQGLMDEEITETLKRFGLGERAALARAIEAKLKEKNAPDL